MSKREFAVLFLYSAFGVHLIMASYHDRWEQAIFALLCGMWAYMIQARP